MNIEIAKDLQAKGIKPYNLFRFCDYPFRWLAAWILWNIGYVLECPLRLSWPWIHLCNKTAWVFSYLRCPNFARWIWGYESKIEHRIFKAEQALLNRSCL